MVFSKSTKQFLHFSRWNRRWNHTWLEGRKLTSYSKWSGDIPWFFSEQLLSDITSARKVKRKLVSRWDPKMSHIYNNKSLMSWYLAYHKWKCTQNDNCTSKQSWFHPGILLLFIIVIKVIVFWFKMILFVIELVYFMKDNNKYK